jgi:addiction module RelE/StbE family toxin
MMTIAYSSSFKRAFKKRIKNRAETEVKFWEMIKLFLENPFDERLKTHKLSGKLRDLWSFTIEYDVRVIFYFAEEQKAVFVDVGKHDEVY